MNDNLPVPDDAPWLNLSVEEVNELRNKKFELTKYAQDKIRKLMNQKALELSVESVVECETKELEEND